MWAIKAGILFFLLIINPLLAGFAIPQEGMSWKRIFVSGVFIHWGSFEVICVICTLLRTSFHTVVYIYIGLFILLDIYGLFIAKHSFSIYSRPKEKQKADACLYMAVLLVSCLILFQASMLGFGQHEDLDDASYITATTTTLETDSMYKYNQQTGELAEELDYKRALSAFPQYFAFLSFTSHIHPAIIARTLYPLWAIPFAYVIYGMLGEKLFGNRKLYKWIFLLFLCVFHIFGYNSVYTSSSFLLLRIWQGKATLAAIVIPYLWYQSWAVMGQQPTGKGQWACLEIGILAACLTTTMGVMLAPILCGSFEIGRAHV